MSAPPPSVWDDLDNAFQSTKQLSDQIVPLFGAYSTGKSVLQALGILASDPSLSQVWEDLKQSLMAIQSKLDAYYKEIEIEILGLGHQLLREAVSLSLAKARQARTQATGYIKNPTDPERQSDFNAARNNALAALYELQPPAFWVQIYAPSTFYSDPWMGVISSGVPVDNLVRRSV